MTVFPSLRPTSRTIEPASWPISSFTSMSGKETRVLLADTPSAHSITLQFANLLEADANLILAHWQGQLGTANSFLLSDDVWAGWTAFAATVESSLQWRYSRQPSINTISPSIMTVSVRLVSLT